MQSGGVARGWGWEAKRCRRLAGPGEATAGPGEAMVAQSGHLGRQQTASAAHEAGSQGRTPREGGAPYLGGPATWSGLDAPAHETPQGQTPAPAEPRPVAGRALGTLPGDLTCKLQQSSSSQEPQGQGGSGVRMASVSASEVGGEPWEAPGGRPQGALVNFHFLRRRTFSQFQKEKNLFFGSL